VGQGATAPRRRRRARAGVRLLALAVGGRGLVDPAEPVFRADDEALLRGAAAFETLRVYGGKPFLLERHLERLQASCRALGLPSPDGVAELARTVAAAAPSEHVLRLYRTESALVASAAELPEGLEEQRARGSSLRSVEAPVPDLLAGVKATSYALSFAARQAAEAAGADDALLVAGGIVRETATANIWWRAGDELYTPASGPGVLPGVTRAFALELVPAHEGRFPLAELARADEAFTTSSIREVMPIVEVDGAPVGDGRPGPAAARLQALLRLRSSR
jgi:branched-subunit amino acid aminotransferase/4-amino-4-deoxychorismate lyase